MIAAVYGSIWAAFLIASAETVEKDFWELIQKIMKFFGNGLFKHISHISH